MALPAFYLTMQALLWLRTCDGELHSQIGAIPAIKLVIWKGGLSSMSCLESLKMFQT